MKKNVGNIDKWVRILIAVAVAVVLGMKVVALASTLGIILAIVGAIMLITALVGTCPLYMPFGISTCKVEPKEK